MIVRSENAPGPAAPLPTESGSISPYRALAGELLRLLEERATAGESRQYEAFDPPAFLLWTLAGLELFGTGTPSYQSAAEESRWVMTTLARLRCCGNITQMAALLGSSRRAVRQALKDFGLYAVRGDPGASG